MKRNIKGTATLQGLASTVNGLVVTVDELREMLGFVVERMATKDDVVEVIRKEIAPMKEDIVDLKKDAGDLKKDMITTKTAVLALQSQMNGVEGELREMRHERLTLRVSDLEEKVFGRSRY